MIYKNRKFSILMRFLPRYFKSYYITEKSLTKNLNAKCCGEKGELLFVCDPPASGNPDTAWDRSALNEQEGHNPIAGPVVVPASSILDMSQFLAVRHLQGPLKTDGCVRQAAKARLISSSTDARPVLGNGIGDLNAVHAPITSSSCKILRSAMTLLVTN